MPRLRGDYSAIHPSPKAFNLKVPLTVQRGVADRSIKDLSSGVRLASHKPIPHAVDDNDGCRECGVLVAVTDYLHQANILFL